MDVTLHAFSGLDGSHLGRLEFSSLSWSDSINEAGDMSAVISPGSGDLGASLRPYGTVLAAMCGGRVLHAGYVTKTTTEYGDGSTTASAGGGLTILEKRLVINHDLDASWSDGVVLIDEENPPGSWLLTLRGTYRDIVRGLIAETMKWGALPISLPPVDGGAEHERNYQCWDLATVADRIYDIGDLQDGPEIRLDPRISDGRMSFELRVENEIRDHEWRWNPGAPGQGVVLGSVDRDGSYVCTQSFGTGGKDDDNLLVARCLGGTLESMGWPVLQVANTSHTSVSILSTLKSYVEADVDAGDRTQDTLVLTCPISCDVRPGDWADVRIPASGGEGSSAIAMKVTDVSGDASSMRLTVSMRPREV